MRCTPLLCALLNLLGIGLLAAGEKQADKPAAPANPIVDLYRGYKPDFIDLIRKNSGYGGVAVPFKVDKKYMKLSSEKAFYTLNRVELSERANALVKAGIEREHARQYREALEIYQQVLDKYRKVLYRVSPYGVFVQIGQYCQRRILRMPPDALAFYRTKHDARARELFEQSKQKRWLLGFSEIAENMMATSYGDKALFELGKAALDNGHYLQGLEYFETIRDYFPNTDLPAEQLGLCIRMCRKMLGLKNPAGKDAIGTTQPRSTAFAEAMKKVLAASRPEQPPFLSQCASAPHAATDDYTLMAPPEDPMALKDPVWRAELPGSRMDFMVFTQPVITKRSVIYRHKNIIYCRSTLNGKLRWKNDIGGRVVWQSVSERQFPMEDLVVADRLVITPMYKVGPSLVALDEVTGQVRWAYGPMAASTARESKMRFESAPAVGPSAVYAVYILDNIEGETHTDTECGLIAFEPATGRVLWDTRMSRLQPGKFASGFAEYRPNRIRSFSSPPLYHEGTVYVCTNAGAVAALDALSGRVKWLMRYPYYPTVHDATRQFGGVSSFTGGPRNPWNPQSPSFWFNQRPLLMGDRLITLPVDTRLMLCLNRKTGKVEWSRFHPNGYTFVAGPTREGHLVAVRTVRASSHGAVQLLDPKKKGAVVWQSQPIVLHDEQPVMRHPTFGPPSYPPYGGANWNHAAGVYPGARPLLTKDGRLLMSGWTAAHEYYNPFPWAYHLTDISLNQRRVLTKRRYYTPQLQMFMQKKIWKAPVLAKSMQSLPRLNKKQKDQIEMLKQISKDHPPPNKYPPFKCFSRLTFERFGVQFELRFGPEELGMVYEAEKLNSVLATRKDADASFARAEIAINLGKYRQASKGLNRCLKLVSAEDLDFRTQVNQQLYTVEKELARLSVASGQGESEIAHAEAMSRSGTQLADEIETLFVLSEAHERSGDYRAAARPLRSIIERYGHYGYAMPSFFSGDLDGLLATTRRLLEQADTFPKGTIHAPASKSALRLLRKGAPLYFTSLSPLRKDLMVRAGDLAIRKLSHLQKVSTELSKAMESDAEQALRNTTFEEQYFRIRSFPGTRVSQRALQDLLRKAKETVGSDAGLADKAKARKRMWALADLARVCGLKLPDTYRKRLLAPTEAGHAARLKEGLIEQKADLADEQSTAWLVAQRRDHAAIEPDLVFLAGRIRKKLDSKFVLHGHDLKSGRIVWKAKESRGEQWFEDLRLQGKGNEPGFFEVYVHGDVVVTHGLYDVLAFNLKDGKLKWRFRTPHGFDIRHALFSGDLMILQGKSETLGLYVPTQDPRGEVAWQVKEEGDPYVPGYLTGNRLVSVRKLPFGVTVRYRSTGKLIGQLSVPDLSLERGHPLIDPGPRALPVAHEGDLLIVTDGWYYIAIDVRKIRVVWKRLIDANDPTREPKMRFALGGEYLAVLKEDFDQKMLYMLSSRTGEVLWPRRGGKDGKQLVGRVKPMHQLQISKGRLYGIIPHKGQQFAFACVDCKTGRPVFRPHDEAGYGGIPQTTLIKTDYGGRRVVQIKDRQDFELKVFNAESGKLEQALSIKGAGSFGKHGRVSATVQNGQMALLGGNDLVTAVDK